MLNVGSCFSGIGGLELGLERTGGFKTKWQIENDPYASAVLAKRWPDVKRFSDITDVAGDELEPIDVICGGFPCQDVSMASARAGLDGKRSTLWGEMYRLVCELKPRWVVAENVPGLLSSDDGRFFGNILRDLAHAGYDAEWGMLSAAGVGAPHLRQRIFLVAKLADTVRHGRREGRSQPSIWRRASDFIRRRSLVADPARAEVRSGQAQNGAGEPDTSERFGNGCVDVADSAIQGFSDRRNSSTQPETKESKRRDWWSTEPNVGRVAHGIPSRVDRLRCLGNAVVPQVAQRVGEMILAVNQ